MRRHPLDTQSPAMRGAFQIGYQEALRDIADAHLRGGDNAVRHWLSDNYVRTEHVRMAILPTPDVEVAS